MIDLMRTGERTLLLEAGGYQVEYGPVPGPKLSAAVRIRRKEMPAAEILTRMAHGPSFNITDYGTHMGYEHAPPRKDFDMFRSLECAETPEGVQARIRTARTWADFEGTLTAYKDAPGLIRWTVRIRARHDKAISEPPLPDCEFRLRGGAARHDLVRHMVQRGPASGIVFFRDLPMQSEVFYFEDFSSLSRLYELTGCANPFLGFTDNEQRGAVRLGPAVSEFQPVERGGKAQPPQPYKEAVEQYERFGYLRPQDFRIPRGAELVIADTYLFLRPAVEDDNAAVCRAFVEMLAGVYTRIPKPPTIATDWAGEVVPRLVRDIQRPENSHITKGQFFPRAYVGYQHEDCQLWTVGQLLLPLTEYCKKYPEQKEAAALKRELEDTLPLFFDEQWKGFLNNLPPMPKMHFHGVYIFNPAMLVADLATAGSPDARRMILAYRPKLLEMGRKCDYVFADVSTEDLSQQKGWYQFDNTCLFMYIMMRLHQLSGGTDAEALTAAKAAAEKLAERRMDLAWEIHHCASGMVACDWLCRVTGEARYGELAWIPTANTLRWAWLWQGDYGVGKHIATFWGFSPTPANPQTCECENHQVRRFVKDYLKATGSGLPPDIRALLEDCWRRGPTQSRFSLPPYAVQAGAQQYMAAPGPSETDCGVVDYGQMIPLEDVRGGWGTDMEWFQSNSKLGQIGQEIYGAGGPIWYALWQEELN